MSEIIGIILLIYGISGLIQSFRSHDTMNEIIKAGRDPSSLESSLRSTRIIGVLSITASIYLLGFYGN
jgi:uncharacterized membrane protein HdeD (DUF308 family)